MLSKWQHANVRTIKVSMCVPKIRQLDTIAINFSFYFRLSNNLDRICLHKKEGPNSMSIWRHQQPLPYFQLNVQKSSDLLSISITTYYFWVSQSTPTAIRRQVLTKIRRFAGGSYVRSSTICRRTLWAPKKVKVTFTEFKNLT